MKNFSSYLKDIGEIGYIDEVMHGIIYVSGLPNAMPNEIVVFESGEYGQILSLTSDHIEVLAYSSTPLKVGMQVSRTNSFLEVPVGEELLGEIIDPFGASLDHLKPIKTKTTRPVDIIPAGI